MVTATVAIAASIALAGCETDGIDMAKAMKPLSPQMLAEIESKDMTKEAPILVRIFKEEAELEVWKEDRSGRFALLKSYPICRWSGELGPKIKDGDRQAPEGFYTITPGQMNPKSSFYLSFNLGYPNAFDRAHGRTGAHLMVHGDCSSRGCYSMTDEQIAEIYALGREAFFGGQTAFQVQAYPFRMTPLNMAKHRNNPHMAFWKNIKEGYDHFEVTRLQPKVDVCEKRYVFNAEAPDASKALNFSAAGRCPAYEVQPDIAMAFAEKSSRDNEEFAQFVRRGTPMVPVKTGRDGGMHPTFLAKLNVQQNRSISGDDRFVSSTDDKPLGSYVNPPRDPAAAPPAPATMMAEADVPMPRPSPLRRTSVAAAVSTPAASLPLPSPSGLVNSVMSLAGGDSVSSRSQGASNRGSDGVLDRVGSTVTRWIGLGGNERRSKAVPAQQKQMATAKPAAPAEALAQPRPGAATPAPLASAPTPPARPQSKPQPVREAQAAKPADQPASTTTGSVSGLMAGATPMMKTDSFESRFGGLR